MKYILEQTAWLDNRKKTWTASFNQIISSFHDRIESLIDNLKEDYNDKDDPIKVHQEYIDYINDAFDDLRGSIRAIDDEDILIKLWDELSLNLIFWKAHFKKMSEDMDNYNSIFKLGYEIFNMITTYNTNKIKKDYYEQLDHVDMDDKRENISKFIKKTKIAINNRIVDMNSADIFSMSNLDEKEIKDYTLNHGDEVRYYMADGEENTAIISHNQENLKDHSYIRLVSKQNGEQFEVDRSELIEIIPKHRTLNQEIANKLKKIKDDPDKLKELDKYLDKLKMNESFNITEDIITDILLMIFPKADGIKYHKSSDILSFKLNRDNREGKIVDVKGIFNIGNSFRIIGSDIKETQPFDYFLFVNKHDIFVFENKPESIEYMSNGDVLCSKDIYINNYDMDTIIDNLNQERL